MSLSIILEKYIVVIDFVMITVVLGDRCEAQEIDDIGEVADDDSSDWFGAAVVEAEIVAVIGADNYRSCRNCNAKVSVFNEFMGERNCRSMLKRILQE